MRPTTRSFWTAVFSLMLVITSIAQPIAAQDVPAATPVAGETETPVAVATEPPVVQEAETPAADEAESSAPAGKSGNSISAQARPAFVFSVPNMTVPVDPTQSFSVTFTITPDEAMSLSPRIDIFDGAYSWTDFSPVVHEPNIPYVISHTIPADNIAAACTDGQFTLMLEMVVGVESSGEVLSLGQPTWNYTCVSSLTVISPTLAQPVVAAQCGPNNDDVTPAVSQPTGVDPVPVVSEWINGAKTLTYAPATGYEFAEGYNPVIIVDDDPSVGCSSPTVEYSVPDPSVPVDTGQPLNVTMTVTPDEAMEISPRVKIQTHGAYIWSDYSPELHEPDIAYVINHTIPADAIAAACIDGHFTLMLEVVVRLASSNEMFNLGQPTWNYTCVSSLTVINPTLAQPVIAAHCGPDNDEVTPAETQPEGVDPVPLVSEWDGGVKALTYSPATGYEFAEGYNPVITVTDDAGECIVVTPTHEVNHIEVCEADSMQINDIITLIPQEGVEVLNQSWGNGEFLIYIGPAEGYIFSSGDPVEVIRVRDTSTLCDPASLELDETITVLEGVDPGDQVSIPATLTVPMHNPYDAASVTFIPGTGTEATLQPTLTLGTGESIPLSFYYIVPENFAETCSANQGTMPIMLGAQLTGPSIADGILETSASLPCSIGTDVPTLTVSVEGDGFVNVLQGDTVAVVVTITIPDGHPYDLMIADMFVQQAIPTQTIFYREFIPIVGSGEIYEFTLDVPVNEAVVNECNVRDELLLSNIVGFYVPNNHTYPETRLSDEGRFPCSILESVTPNLNLVVHNAICGVATTPSPHRRKAWWFRLATGTRASIPLH